MNRFSNSIKYKSELGEIKYSNAYGSYLFQGLTSGLALKYVGKGTEHYYVDNQIIPIEKDHFILIQPNTNFEANTKINCGETLGLCIDLSLFFSKTKIKRICKNELLFNLPIGFSKSTAIGTLLKRMNHSMQFDKESILNQQSLFNLGRQLNHFSQEVLNIKEAISTDAKKPTTQRSIIPNLLKAREYIYTNFTEKIVLEEIAQHATMSKFQFLRIFKKGFQCSPLEMQTSLRMNKALMILSNSKDSIAQIAFDIGYYDIAAFSKKFKTHFGVSPTNFRKEQYFTKE